MTVGIMERVWNSLPHPQPSSTDRSSVSMYEETKPSGTHIRLGGEGGDGTSSKEGL